MEEKSLEHSDLWTVQRARPVDELQLALDSVLGYFHLLGKLKTTKREGWRRHGIDHGESIADHCHRMAMMAMLAPQNLDLQKCLNMSLIHDVAESIVGDITPMDAVSKTEKNRREALTMNHFRDTLGPAGALLWDWWQEFEAGETPESKFVQDLDKIELLLQMVEYEKEGKCKTDLGSFAGAATKIKTPECKAWATEILKAREGIWGDKEHVRGELGEEGGISKEFKKQQDDYYSETR
ncbi:HD domain-containing protein [Colletotrichum godetiae]|uniref:5'-deoxynucleotidase n=1 Tax=Colletotrichum godetiae TaxID=1209918 RepID=A0AAJ0EPV1_9PEZI|nr:HD domain-containing protein [Colletotrichum godetiae]KAK1656974.1 HD domain-containing protein [Colletotrichum godetiae]